MRTDGQGEYLDFVGLLKGDGVFEYISCRISEMQMCLTHVTKLDMWTLRCLIEITKLGPSSSSQVT